jgi:hypothetical protein
MSNWSLVVSAVICTDDGGIRSLISHKLTQNQFYACFFLTNVVDIGYPSVDDVTNTSENL